jgi:FixJ family two-component response regulator
MTESECIHCGATDDPEHGVMVGLPSSSAHEGSVCTICQAEHLQDVTVLSPEESKIQAHKDISDATHQRIADRLDLEKSTVDTYSQRIRRKHAQAKQTVRILTWD